VGIGVCTMRHAPLCGGRQPDQARRRRNWLRCRSARTADAARPPTRVLPAAALGNATPGQANQFRAMVDAFVNGALPTVAIAAKTREAYRPAISLCPPGDVADLLTENLSRLEAFIAAQPEAVRRKQNGLDAAVLEAEGEAATARAVREDVPDVYVCSFPDTWRCPDEEGRVKMKLGCSTRGKMRRIIEQVRQAAMPQDPMTLRVYRVRDPKRPRTSFIAPSARQGIERRPARRPASSGSGQH